MSLRKRIKAAVRAFKGKPTDCIHLGVEVKRCDECGRGDCEDCVYKRKFEYWLHLPHCNDCQHNGRNTCGHCPKPGEDVRINCPLYAPKPSIKEEPTNDQSTTTSL